MSLPPRKKRIPPEQRRSEIATHAVDVALSEGLQSVTIKGIARDLGITPGLVIHYFGSLDKLLATVFQAVNERSRLNHTKNGSRIGEPVHELARQLRELVDPANMATSRVWVEAVHASAKSPQLKLAVKSEISRGREALTVVIDDVMDAKGEQLRSSERTATGLLALADGYLLQVWLGDADLGRELSDIMFRHAETELGLSEGILQVGG